MKNLYQFELSLNDLKLFFPEFRIKDKTKILEILLEATRFMISNNHKPNLKNENKLVLNVDKMSRLFFVKKDKIYSITFPFSVTDNNGSLSFTLTNVISVDSEAISNLITIIKNDIFNSKCCLEFAEPIDDLENNFNDNFWLLLKDLMIMEDGYIRYDKDEVGYKEALEKKQKHRHPKNHFDIFYTSKNTFKIGLDNDVFVDEFIDSLNLNTDCKYLRLP